MKISKIISLIFSILAVALAFFSFIELSKIEGNSDFTLVKECKLYASLFLGFAIIAIIVTIIKKEKQIVVPLLGFVTTGIYFVRNIFGDITFHQTVLEIITPTENTSVLTILLFMAFLAFIILSVEKKYNWSKWYVVGYFILLLLSTLKFLPYIAFDDTKWAYSLVSYSMISGYLAFIAFMFPTYEKKKVEKKEEAKELIEGPKEEA